MYSGLNFSPGHQDVVINPQHRQDLCRAKEDEIPGRRDAGNTSICVIANIG